MIIRTNLQAFSRLRTALSVALILAVSVVFAGATVRATGSGMGCPDWPLCYGRWVPPVSADQLPAGYAQLYTVDGHPAEFDAVKTWIEYINRLLGLAAGVSLAVALGLTVPVAVRRPSLGVLSVGGFVVLGLVAWLGAKVVGTFLAPDAVTLHLGAAYLLIGLILAQREIAARAADGPRLPVSPGFAVVLGAVGLMFLAQWTLGIRTREEVEAWLWNQNLPRSLWDSWGGAYNLHRASAVLVGLSVAALGRLGWRHRLRDHRVWKLTSWCAGLVACQAGVGLVLWLGHDPLWAKPFHLVFATAAWSIWLTLVFHAFPPGGRHV